ncbi:MAG: T9SS type A sorting domain-containing protein [Bacteroidetes bacterium]|nr:T9SS type A sorting domain-containing protein [Bacteroidota bacterium]
MRLQKSIIVFFLTVMSWQFVAGQQKLEAYFGEANRDEGCADIIEMYDKGYYIIGGFEEENNNWNGWNIKTDVNLEIIYEKVLENSLSTFAPFSSVSDNHGNIYITGFMNYPDQWPFVVKIDSCGNKQWCKVLIYEDEFNYGSGIDIILPGNNEVVILATLIDDEQPADQINMTHLIGLSDEGEVLWKKPYASRNDYSWIRQPQGRSIKEINDDYYISGFCYWPYPDDTTHWFLRPLFIGIDSLFDEKWILPFAPLDSVFGDAFSSIQLNDSIIMGTGIRMINNDTAHSLLMFYSIDGDELGYHEIMNSQIGNNITFNLFSDIQQINDSLYMTTAYLGSEELGNPHSEFIIDTACNLYSYSIRPNTSGWAYLIKTFDNNYVIATNIEESKGDDDIYVYKIDENLNDVPFDPTPHTYDSLCPGGIQSGTIDLTSCFVWTDVSEAPSPGEYYSFIQTIPIKVFPNPATESSVTFEFENTEHLPSAPPLVPPNGGKGPHLSVYNIFGQLIHTERIYRYQEKTEVNISSWQKGMYFGVVYSGGKAVGKCKFVVQ